MILSSHAFLCIIIPHISSPSCAETLFSEAPLCTSSVFHSLSFPPQIPYSAPSRSNICQMTLPPLPPLGHDGHTDFAPPFAHPPGGLLLDWLSTSMSPNGERFPLLWLLPSPPFFYCKRNTLQRFIWLLQWTFTWFLSNFRSSQPDFFRVHFPSFCPGNSPAADQTPPLPRLFSPEVFPHRPLLRKLSAM